MWSVQIVQLLLTSKNQVVATMLLMLGIKNGTKIKISWFRLVPVLYWSTNTINCNLLSDAYEMSVHILYISQKDKCRKCFWKIGWQVKRTNSENVVKMCYITIGDLWHDLWHWTLSIQTPANIDCINVRLCTSSTACNVIILAMKNKLIFVPDLPHQSWKKLSVLNLFF